jgi:DNA polymerase-3 subunit delta
MITVLTGENGFGRQNALAAAVAAFTAEHGDLALEQIDGEDADLEKITEALQGLPFLAARKMVVLRTPGTNKAFAEQAEHILSDLPETTEVIIVEPKPDKRSAYYKFLKRQPGFQEFAEPDANGLGRWLVDAAQARGGSLSLPDARYLVERVGANQQLLANELEKLLIYDPNVTRPTIDLLTEATPQSTVFQLLEAAFAGNTKKALNLYAEQRAQKVEPQQIVAMLAWQLHIVAIIKTAGDRPADQIAKDAKLSPFVVRKSQGIARNLSFTEVKQLVNSLLQIDAQSKSSAVDADEALQNYIVRLA